MRKNTQITRRLNPIRGSNQEDKYITLIEKLIQLKQYDESNFQEYLKNLYASEIYQTEAQTQPKASFLSRGFQKESLWLYSLCFQFSLELALINLQRFIYHTNPTEHLHLCLKYYKCLIEYLKPFIYEQTNERWIVLQQQ